MMKVIIERVIAEGMESTYDATIKSILTGMLDAPGYLSGATYRDARKPNHRVIITNWQSEEAWNQWAHSAARKSLVAAIKPILEQEEKVTLLTA